jgi:hypothetical protein
MTVSKQRTKHDDASSSLLTQKKGPLKVSIARRKGRGRWRAAPRAPTSQAGNCSQSNRQFQARLTSAAAQLHCYRGPLVCGGQQLWRLCPCAAPLLGPESGVACRRFIAGLGAAPRAMGAIVEQMVEVWSIDAVTPVSLVPAMHLIQSYATSALTLSHRLRWRGRVHRERRSPRLVSALTP